MDKQKLDKMAKELADAITNKYNFKIAGEEHGRLSYDYTFTTDDGKTVNISVIGSDVSDLVTVYIFVYNDPDKPQDASASLYVGPDDGSGLSDGAYEDIVDLTLEKLGRTLKTAEKKKSSGKYNIIITVDGEEEYNQNGDWDYLIGEVMDSWYEPCDYMGMNIEVTGPEGNVTDKFMTELMRDLGRYYAEVASEDEETVKSMLDECNLPPESKKAFLDGYEGK